MTARPDAAATPFPPPANLPAGSADVGAALERVLRLPGVEDAVATARAACTALRWHEGLRRRLAEAGVEATIRAAHCSAAIEGANFPLALIRDVARGAATLPADASGRLALGCLRAVSASTEFGRSCSGAPWQALARLHVAAAAELLPAQGVGRPRAAGQLPGDGVGDPRSAPTGAELAGRLSALGALLSAPPTAPALVVAALVHAEIITLRPFLAGNGLVARAVARAVIVGRGLDPTGVVVWEAGHLDAGPAYTEALRGYASAGPAGVAVWIEHCADAVVRGAAEGRAICDAVRAGRLGPIGT